MIAAIHQPNFLPWLGFFHKMAKSDVFVYFDDVQLPRGKSYCTRVAIKQNNEARWLTVPVLGKSQLPAIKEVQMVQDQPWRQKHLNTLEAAYYKKAPYFNDYFDSLSKVYLTAANSLLEFNLTLMAWVKEMMEIKTKVVCSSKLNLGPLKGTEHILRIVQVLGADIYLTGEGVGSRRYLGGTEFREAGVEIIYQNFNHPVYPQAGQGFIPNLSIIDLLFNQGPGAKKILLG